MNLKTYFLCTALFFGWTTAVPAKVLLPQILSGNMVLQRDKPLNIWGYGSPGEKVTVSFSGQQKTAVTDAKGNWKVLLSPLKTSAVPATMTIKGTNTIQLKNILVGEVWLCSGQSNMEYAMHKLKTMKKPLNEKLGFPANEVANAHNNLIRIFVVNRKDLAKPDTNPKNWNVAADPALKNSSAAGYFFAKELQKQLHVPVGMITSAVSGSAIEPWIPAAILAGPDFQGQYLGSDPGKFYPTMIEPLMPFAIKGVIWYQGETNCFRRENITYSYKMKALINSWRRGWKNPGMSFYYVQIAPFQYSKTMQNVEIEPEFWEAQAQVMRMPKTGMVVTTDLNDKIDELHPTYKWEVGRRLALWALARDYGKKIVYSGPMYQSVKFKGATAELQFNHIGSGLKSSDGKALSDFSIAGADGRFVPAVARISGTKVLVSAAAVKKPVAVRFGWTESASPNLYNKNGLPALPFRTDNPLITQFNPI
ncbi:sialate O-acetylesterase [Pedobacter heparinus]|uniref:Sialate O-acetylesterase n=1 Tax=Pedobacter heparinus (strain ATCC 13125 / DSM 2366 / CIP 104194 / JCM 7457 / NBRC 12017 / NCIMB 9290 / NRRL B-14731 / HIM 762-3) TaxID=485917 RepID=C6Y155_PEDHD|nr:sialate O-acetylesterase [Pedobacter heparinus]ACU04982.1 Sialate O-acetylesterase [Pedobacter heparinus DSM 2366]